MTRHVTGTVTAFTTRREECEEAIRMLSRAGGTEPKQVLRLRRQLGDQLASLVLSVAGLQMKARKKLQPDRQSGTPANTENSPLWWVTEKSLQQATAWQVAQLKSTWFDDGLVHDLCCGIGGDAIQLAGLDPSNLAAKPETERLVAVDSDDLIAQMAAANLRRWGAEGRSRVCCADAATVDLPADAAIHIDPDRRPGGERGSRPATYQPDWETVMRITNNAATAVIKLAPAAKLESTGLAIDELRRMHRCWISLSGSVREQSLLLGGAIDRAGLTCGTKSAVSLATDGAAEWFAPGNEERESPASTTVTSPLSYLVDPNASIRAAGLTAAFARVHRLRLLGKPSGFLTSDQQPAPATARMAVIGNVIWAGTCDDRRIRRELRSRGVYPAVIKVRGTQHDPATLARRYRTCGEDPVTLWIGRAGDRAFAALTQ